MCQCGLKLSDHENTNTTDEKGPWTDNSTYTASEPTNAFGEIRFPASGKVSKVILC